MDIFEARNKETYILAITGRLDAITSPDLRNKIMSSIELGERSILLDCTNLEYVSSAGLRVLFEASFNLNQVSGNIKICSINNNVKKIFDMVDLTSEVAIFSSQEEALK